MIYTRPLASVARGQGRGRGQILWGRGQGQKIWPWGRVGLEDLTSLRIIYSLNRQHVISQWMQHERRTTYTRLSECKTSAGELSLVGEVTKVYWRAALSIRVSRSSSSSAAAVSPAQSTRRSAMTRSNSALGFFCQQTHFIAQTRDHNTSTVHKCTLSAYIVTIWKVVFANKSRKLGWIWMKLGRWGWGLKRPSLARFQRNRAMGLDSGESAKK